jgi:hypothetical protein
MEMRKYAMNFGKSSMLQVHAPYSNVENPSRQTAIRNNCARLDINP